MNRQQQFSPARLNGPEPSKPSSSETVKRPDGTNFQTFIRLRQEFRADFASRFLLPCNFSHRIDAMATAASNAILLDTKVRNINSVTSVLCQGDKSNPIRTAEAMAFLWVYVGTVDEVTKRRGPILVTQAVDGQLRRLFRVAVKKDQEKNLPHVAHLWRKVRQCHPPESGFPSTLRIFMETYYVDLDKVPTPEGGMEQLFDEMSSFSGKFRKPSTSLLANFDEDWEVETNPVKKIQVASVEREMKDKPARPVKQGIDLYFLKHGIDPQKISQDVTPKSILKPSSSSSTSRPRQKVAPVKAENKSIATTVKVRNVETATTSTSSCQQKVAPVKAFNPGLGDKSKPGRAHTASTSKQRRPRSEFEQSPKNSKVSAAKNDPPKKMDSDFLLFFTNPGEYIRMNPTLFPSNNANWSARKILPDAPIKRNKPNNPVDADDPVPEVHQQTLADCTETMLRVDFTPEEYIDQTTASNYYAQGVKIVEGVRRVVFYHKMINPSDIKKEEPI